MNPILKHRATLIKIVALVLLILLLLLAPPALKRAELKAPDPTFLLLDRRGRHLARMGAEGDGEHGFWPVEALPERVATATLTLEDQRFWSHPGVDPLAIARAAWQNMGAGRRVSGASTIAMQVARMQSPGSRTFRNKAVEALTALFLTIRYGREALLKHYLKIAPYGNRVHGVAYAARLYLDKPVEDLSWAEIAFLSAIPQAPGRMNPFNPMGRMHVRNRGMRMLALLHERGSISREEWDLARGQLLRLRLPEQKRRRHSALHAILKLETMLRSAESGSAARRKSGLVHTTLDLELQDWVALLAKRYLEKWRPDGAGNTAVIVTKRDNPEVLAWLGSADYFGSDAGAIDYTRVSRSPGSALKPFVYALALERGRITPATVLDDLRSAAMGVNNADMAWLGPMIPRRALANSRNVPAIQLIKTVGVDEVYLFLRELGLHADEQSARYYGLCMAVGCLPTSLEKLVRAYGALANDGLFRDLEWFQGRKAGSPRRVLSETSARQITLFLSDPMARLPSFPRMGSTEYPFPAAVKTGTSQGYRDAWAMVYSRDYMVGVWVGRPDSGPMNKLGGSHAAARLARRILLHLHPDQAAGMADLGFPPPKGYAPVEISVYTGQRPAGAGEPTLLEWFPGGVVPGESQTGTVHRIDVRNNLLATSWTPPEMIRERAFIHLPPRYASWARGADIPLPPTEFSPRDLPPGIQINSAAKTGAPGTYTLKGVQPVHLAIDSPEDGLRLLFNPETPASRSSLALRASTSVVVPEVLWCVDGQPYKLADPARPVRWPLRSGVHSFQVRLPFRDEMSKIVRVVVE